MNGAIEVRLALVAQSSEAISAKAGERFRNPAMSVREESAMFETAMVSRQKKGLSRHNRIKLAATSTVALLLQAEFCLTAESASLSVNGVTFSDRLGGLILEKVTGEGSMDDPFVLVERMTDSNGGTLSFHVEPDFGNRVGSAHAIAFAVIKVIQNATELPCNSFELELQSKLGTPSDYGDGLPFRQGSNAGKPFSSDGFDQVILMDEPYYRIQFDHGKISIGAQVTLRFVLSESVPLAEAYLLQRPGKPVADGPSKAGEKRYAAN
jgi:hypothetical protein